MNSTLLPRVWPFQNSQDYPSMPDEGRELWLDTEELEGSHQIIMHNHTVPTNAALKCAHDGCIRTFDIVLYPDQYIYPRYCDLHLREDKGRMEQRW